MKSSRFTLLPAGIFVMALLILVISGCLGGGGGGGVTIHDLNPPPWAPALEWGSISGTVFTDVPEVQGRVPQPLEGATVRLLTGETTVTDENGEFAFPEALMGFYTITISKDGYNTLAGRINILPIDETHIYATLSEAPAEPGEAILYIRGIGYSTGPPLVYWVGVKSIKVWDKEDESLTWERDWDNDWYEYPYTINCHGLEVGRTYMVQVTWGNSALGDQKIETYEVVKDDNPFQVVEFTPDIVPPEPETGSISGIVVQEVDQGGEIVEQPIEDVQVTLQDVSIAQTAADGTFSFTDVEVGSYLLTAFKDGFNIAGGFVTVQADSETTVHITLVPAGGGGGGGGGPEPGTSTTLDVVAHGYYNLDDVWVGVKSIVVWEYDHFETRWSDSWDYDWWEPSYTLECDGVETGKYYNIQITYGAEGVDEEIQTYYNVLVDELNPTKTYYH